jgi:hypothetical protein
MFALVLVLAFVLALAARLAIDIRQDRPASPPRSHWHELDQRSARIV